MRTLLAALMLEVGIAATAGALPAIERVAITAKRATMVFAASTEPASITIDPHTWLLFEAGSFTKAR